MNNKMDFEKYQFVNLPRPMPESDYQEVCQLVVDKLKNKPGIRSIYLSSGSWIPGISDVDIIIVCNQGLKGKIDIISLRNLSEKTKYLFLHGSWILKENTFKRINYLTPGLSLKLLWGEEISIDNPQKDLSQEDNQLLYAGLIFDYLINKLLLFPRFFKKTELNTRQLLGEIYSLTYTLQIFELIAPGAIQTDFSQRIIQLRQTWFNNPQEENLRELTSLLEESIDLILELTAKLADFIAKKNLPMSTLVFNNRKYYIVFSQHWTKKEFIDNFEKGYIAFKRPFSNVILENFKLTLPSPLSYFLIAYASQAGLLSAWIRNNLNNYQQTDLLINQGIISHVKIINDSAAENKKHGFGRIPFPYGSLVGSRTFLNFLGDELILFLRRIKK